MIKISHRGNTDGPNPDGENQPHQLVSTISQGFDIEVDVWYWYDQFYLGHDEPKHPVNDQFILDIAENSWFHCKNIEALQRFTEKYPELRFFWHQEDDYTLTSNGYIWTYPGKEVTEKSIVVDLDGSRTYTVQPYAVCTDYPRSF